MEMLDCYIVQVRLAFDDPVVGVYADLQSAIRRAKHFIKNPGKAGDFVDASDVTGWIGIDVYEWKKAKFKSVWSEYLEGERAALMEPVK